MTSSSLPDHWQELIAGYALGDLSPEEAEELTQLLAAHPELTAEVQNHQEVLALMPYGLPDLPEQTLPAHLRSDVLTAAQASLPSVSSSISASISASTPLQSAPDPRLPSPSRRLRRLKSIGLSVGTAAAALLVLTLAIDNHRLRQDVQQTQAALAENQALLAVLQQPGNQLYALTGTDAAATAAGSLVINPTQQRAIVLVSNLPTLSNEQVYRLWAMPQGSTTPAYCGQFTAGTTSFVLSDVACRVNVSQMLVTIESASAPPVPSGALVLKSGA